MNIFAQKKTKEKAMSEQNTIPAEMLGAAAKAVGKYLASLCIDSVDKSAIAEAALRAAGVPELVARIAELEAANIKLRAEIEVLETENAALEDELSEYSQ